MRAYGLKLNSLEVEETSGTCTTHNFSSDDPSSTVPTNTGSTSKYSTLTEDDKKKVEEVLFLLDRFSVSEEFYHELTTVCDGLPRSYLVKQCKSHLNEFKAGFHMIADDRGSRIADRKTFCDCLRLYGNTLLRSQKIEPYKKNLWRKLRDMSVFTTVTVKISKTKTKRLTAGKKSGRNLIYQRRRQRSNSAT